MLTGERVVLRATNREDIEPQHAQIAPDYALHAITSGSAWRPEAIDEAYTRYEKGLADTGPAREVWFTVARRDDPELAWVGRAGLWRIDEHQRTAHVGITLAAAVRGQGLGTEVLRLLAEYAFRVRDLHRLGLETLATNEAMLRSARAAGFVEEGRQREAAYVLGDRVDEVLFGLLRSERVAPKG